MNRVDTFRRSVKTMSDTDSASVTTIARFIDTPPPLLSSEPPTTTGSNGKIHGARTVKTPAMNAISSNDMGKLL
jgi:hypothetical protein